jgi:hypothetical protein
MVGDFILISTSQLLSPAKTTMTSLDDITLCDPGSGMTVFRFLPPDFSLVPRTGLTFRWRWSWIMPGLQGPVRAGVLTRRFSAQLRINSSSKWKCQSLANVLANDFGDELFGVSKQLAI